MLRSHSRRLLSLALVSALALVGTLGAATGSAQESGGSFGGSAWDDEPSGGGSSYGGGSSASSSSSSDWSAESAEADRRREEDERRAAEEARAEAEREAARRAAEAAAAAAAAAAERARKLALPPAARVAELTWPATPAYPPVASPRVAALDAPLASAPSESGRWSAPGAPAALTGHVIVYGPFNTLGAVFCGGPPTFGLLALALLLTRRRRPAPVVAPLAGPAMRLSIAFDWTARAALQAELAAMATRFDVRTRPGLSEASRAMAALLAQHAGAARYVSWELSTGDARRWFQTRAQDLRARFRAELVRNDATSATPSFTARESEGQGLVVVSIVVAGKRPIVPPKAAFSLASLGAAIACIADRPPGETLALEVIWSPAAENDRMSSYELEKLYPELQRVTEGVGARQCLYCKGPFPTELGRCPACGAPIASEPAR